MAVFSALVCAGLSFSGSLVHYDTPEAMPVRVDQIDRIMAYAGAYHTPALAQAKGTIFFKSDIHSQNDCLALHVVESPMIIRQRMLAANATPKPAYQVAYAPEVVLAPAPVPPARKYAAPAPVLKPRTPVTSGSNGGF